MLDVILSLDEQILLFFNGYHTEFLDSVMTFISGRLSWVPLYAVLVFLLFRYLHFSIALTVLVGVGLAILLTDQTCASLIRPAIGRLRPSNPDNPFSEMITLVNGYRSGRFGFPSCHAANTFALATVLSCAFRRRRMTVFMFSWAVVVSCSRLYLGVHYPTDIIVGAGIGCMFGWLSFVICTRVAAFIPFGYVSSAR